MSATTTPRRPADRRRPARPPVSLAALMGFEAITLAVFATLHLSGALRIGSGDSDGAGFAEALICVALVGGCWAFVRSPARGRRAALASVIFAVAGFIVGLTFTVRGGDAIDLLYHATMLPVFLGTAILLVRPAVPVPNSQKSA